MGLLGNHLCHWLLHSTPFGEIGSANVPAVTLSIVSDKTPSGIACGPIVSGVGLLVDGDCPSCLSVSQ